MKKLPILLATALLALFSTSCSSGGNDPSSISSSSQNNVSSGSQSNAGDGDFENSGQTTDMETEKPYTGNGKIYLAEKRDKGQLILTAETMLEAGVMSDGKITFALPENVDSRFLTKIDDIPSGMEVKPLGVEVWFYNEPFRLLSNGKHIGDLEYIKILNDGTYHKISYWYFSKNTSINGYVDEMGGMEYKIEAKKSWNKVYVKVNTNTGSSYVTTNLNEVPDGLAWLMWEIN